MRDNEPFFDLYKEYGLFLSRHEVDQHYDLLKNIRLLYKQKRDYLKQLISQYLDSGEWIKPLQEEK